MAISTSSESTPMLTDIGNQIRELRVSRGVSQIDLAIRIGTRQPNISRIESGEHVPTLRTLQKIAEALGARVVVKLD